MDLDDLKPSQLAVLAITILAVIGGIAFGGPQWNKYRRTTAGEATLRAQEFETQVAVEEALAIRNSATLLAEAEVIRSQGIADAIAILADGLGGPEGYLRYLWIQGLHNGSSEVIYIPTEAGLPLLEAGGR